MDILKLSGRDFLPLGLEVGDLPGDQLERSGGASQFENDLWVRVTGPTLALDSHLEGLGQERVARQDGDTFAEDLVVGRLASPEIIVVHGRQVVVDERVSMNAFNGTGQGQGNVRIATAGRRGGQAEGGPHALAAGEKRVAHRLVDGGRLGG